MTHPVAASQIIDGPSNVVLMASFFLEPGMTVTFNVNGALIPATLHFMQAEDGSRESWNIRGSYVHGGKNYKFEAYYHARSKRGHFQPVTHYTETVRRNFPTSAPCPVTDGPSRVKLGLALFDPKFRVTLVLDGNPVQVSVSEVESTSVDQTTWIVRGSYVNKGTSLNFQSRYWSGTRKGDFKPYTLVPMK